MAIFTQKQEKYLLNLIKTECKQNGIKLYISKGKSLRIGNGHKCHGYFCANSKKLAVAKNAPNWMNILLHEYCHLLQYLENCEAWAEWNRIRIDYISEWINGSRTVRKAQLEDIFYKTMMLEKDCEHRRISFLYQMGISRDVIREEIQKANAYILFYIYVRKNQIWNLPKYPSRIKQIWSQCPKNFNYNMYTSFDKIEELYNTHL